MSQDHRSSLFNCIRRLYHLMTTKVFSCLDRLAFGTRYTPASIRYEVDPESTAIVVTVFVLTCQADPSLALESRRPPRCLVLDAACCQASRRAPESTLGLFSQARRASRGSRRPVQSEIVTPVLSSRWAMQTVSRRMPFLSPLARRRYVVCLCVCLSARFVLPYLFFVVLICLMLKNLLCVRRLKFRTHRLEKWICVLQRSHAGASKHSAGMASARANCLDTCSEQHVVLCLLRCSPPRLPYPADTAS